MPPLAPRFCRFQVRSRKRGYNAPFAISLADAFTVADEMANPSSWNCLEMEISTIEEEYVSRKFPNRNEIAIPESVMANPLARLVVLVTPAICEIHDASILGQNEEKLEQPSRSNHRRRERWRTREATTAIARASIDDADKKIPRRDSCGIFWSRCPPIRLERIQIQMSLGHGRT